MAYWSRNALLKSDVDEEISRTATEAGVCPVAVAVNVAVARSPPLFADVTVTVCFAALLNSARLESP